ncbi:venom allergen 3-like [Plodia interpunctella]|uniref:venom allergen 3-like n=1 Tax=Plodia interpunctella TaxID=58824 RepID=UPI002368857E|nr:venom allergen 3-like [Plodia interpunctella]
MHLRGVIFLCLLGCALGDRLTCKQVREIVDGHNERRLRLAKGNVSGQPPASEMKYMIWDDELAAKATKWASRNSFQHNPDNTIGSGRFRTGENLYVFSTTNRNQKINLQATLDSWFNENKDFTYGPIWIDHFNREDGVQIGHYTQMVWSDSVYVGCGISQFSRNPGWTSYMVVCNYGPAGNIIGSVPYPTGNPSNQLTCSFEGCSGKSHYDEFILYGQYGDKC